MVLLGCIPRACKPCNCSAERLKKEPRDSDRDISGLLYRESYKSEAKSWSDNPLYTAAGRQDMATVFATGDGGRGVRRRLPVIGGIDVSLAYQLPGKPEAGARGKHVGSY